MTSTGNITYRMGTEADVKACTAFHNAHWARKMNADQWTWQFLPRLLSSQVKCVVLAEEDEQLIGTQALMPMKFIDPSGVYWTAKSEQTLVAPAGRGRGIFADMYDVAFEHCRRNAIKTIWGYTQAGLPFKRVGFNVTAKSRREWTAYFGFNAAKFRRSGYTLREFFRQVVHAGKSMTRQMQRLASDRAAIAGLEIRRWETAPEEMADLCHHFVEDWGGATIFRDKAFLDWRLSSNPFVDVQLLGAYLDKQLVGYCAYSTADESGAASLVDIIVAPRNKRVAADITRTLVMFALKQAQNSGAREFVAWGSPPHPYGLIMEAVFRKLGFYRRELPTNVVHYVVEAPVLGQDGTVQPLYGDYQAWFVTMLFMQGHRG